MSEGLYALKPAKSVYITFKRGKNNMFITLKREREREKKQFSTLHWVCYNLCWSGMTCSLWWLKLATINIVV